MRPWIFVNLITWIESHLINGLINGTQKLDQKKRKKNGFSFVVFISKNHFMVNWSNLNIVFSLKMKKNYPTLDMVKWISMWIEPPFTKHQHTHSIYFLSFFFIVELAFLQFQQKPITMSHLNANMHRKNSFFFFFFSLFRRFVFFVFFIFFFFFPSSSIHSRIPFIDVKYNRFLIISWLRHSSPYFFFSFLFFFSAFLFFLNCACIYLHVHSTKLRFAVKHLEQSIHNQLENIISVAAR